MNYLQIKRPAPHASAAKRWSMALICAAALTLMASCGYPASSDGDPYAPPPRADTGAQPAETMETTAPADAQEKQSAEPDKKRHPKPEKEPPRSAVPAELQGTWDGDDAAITLGGDGDLLIVKESLRLKGTVVVEGAQMTFHLPDAEPQLLSWSWQDCQDPAGYGYAYRTLFLNGYSYVQDC